MMEKALLVYVTLVQRKKDTRLTGFMGFSEAEKKEEFIKLVKSTGCEVLEIIPAKIDRPTASLFIGKGKAEEISLRAQELGAGTIIFSNALSPAQQRNLEDIINVKILDKIQLILDIFARHAHSVEGQIEVELAQLKYLLPRLKGKGIILSRLGGGIGTRGPGEKKLEIERRRITDHITMLHGELTGLNKHRDVMRKKKTSAGIPTLSLVGYTNAGKSTLMNAITAAAQKTDDSYFTTLDTINRQIAFPSEKNAVLTDTVGFMADLPPYLIESFKTTLRELEFAALLVHVIDCASSSCLAQIRAVNEVLDELGLCDKPRVTVFNKIDLIAEPQRIDALQGQFPEGVFISALKKQNIDTLLARIERLLFTHTRKVRVTMEIKDAGDSHLLYDMAEVKTTAYEQNKAVFSILVEETNLKKLMKLLENRAQFQMEPHG